MDRPSSRSRLVAPTADHPAISPAETTANRPELLDVGFGPWRTRSSRLGTRRGRFLNSWTCSPGGGRARRRRSHRAALTGQPAVQSRCSPGQPRTPSDRLRAHRRARRASRQAAPRRTVAEWLLGERQLRNYADYALTPGFRTGDCPPARAWRGTPRGDHVRRGGLVAVPPAHHRGLPPGGRRGGVSHPRTSQDRGGQDDARCPAGAGRGPSLPRRPRRRGFRGRSDGTSFRLHLRLPPQRFDLPSDCGDQR